MARSDEKSMGKNKFAWPEKGRILKFEKKGFLIILQCMLSYPRQRKGLNFKWLMCIGNDEKDWEKDRGNQ